MGRLFLITLEAEDGGNILRCRHCQTHLAFYQTATHAFPRGNGMAYIFPRVVNVTEGEQWWELTHRDYQCYYLQVFCIGCGSCIGRKIKVVWPLILKYLEEQCLVHT